MISDFCKKLGLDKCGIHLYPKQQEILDDFYCGGFYGDGYRELVAIIGRRGGKDTIASIIALKEAAFLLEQKNPFDYYGLAPGNPIHIMLVSCSSEQSRVLFNNCKHYLLQSNLFKDRIGRLEQNRICLRTDDDIKQGSCDGSVVIMSAGCQSDSLLGKRVFTLIFNEAAYFTNPGRVYSALTPAITEFRNPTNGRLDSKVITTTCPGTENDFVHKLYSDAKLTTYRLAVKLATWEINNKLTEDQLRQEFRFWSDEEFNTDFGAQFATAEGNQTVSLRLPNCTISAVKRLARKMSFEQDEDISYNDVIKSAIDEMLRSNRGEMV